MQWFAKAPFPLMHAVVLCQKHLKPG